MKRLLASLIALATIAAAPVGTGYRPVDKDEQGLWAQTDQFERQLQTSAFVIRDSALNHYVRAVFCRTVTAERCADVRIYLIRTAAFNASMAPTGLLLVNSGLLLRMRDEAQLAAVLAHEYAHYANRHSLQGYRDLKGKANALGWLGLLPVGGYVAGAALSLAQIGVMASHFGFGRAMEVEADAASVPMLTSAGYDASAAWHVWDQVRQEMDATAAARKRASRKDKDGGLFASHPPTAERLATLKTLTASAPGGDAGRAGYRVAMSSWWPALIDDQIKLNDFGATDLLIRQAAADDWTPELLYAKGENHRARGRPADLGVAADAYRAALAIPGAPVDAWRGLGLVELRAGHEEAGQAALIEYLKRRPDAPDRAMLAMLAEATP